MNLVNDPWIPVVYRTGTPAKISLLDAFSQGEEIFDLPVRPHERIALMRLMICIAQVALDGPADHTDLLHCRKQMPQAATNYLEHWREAFELFGEGQRFLQVPNL